MRISKALIAVMLLPLLFAGSCSKGSDETLVAEIADRTITLAAFQKAWMSVDSKYLPETEDLEGRKEFLQTMINKELLAIKADELGYDKDPYVVQGMEAFKKVGLQAGYLKIKVADKINVTEKDLREAHELFGTNLQIKQIIVDTMEEAEEAYQLIQEGTDFETACKQYSKAPDAATGGKAITAMWGTFEPHIQDVLFAEDMKVGDVTKPIPSRYGYLVLKILQKTQPKKRSFEEARPDLEQMVYKQQELRLTRQMSDDVRAKYGFEWFDDNMRVVFDALPPDRPLTNPPDRGQEVYPLLEFDAADLDKPLVGYRGKTITVKDFSDLYDRASFFNRPRKEFRFGGIKKFLLDIVMNELVEVEMKESDIENEPVVARMLQRKREQFMVDKLFQDLVEKQTQVSPKDMQDYYNDNIEQFRRDEQRRVGIVLTNDLDTATEAYNKIMAGESFDRVSAEHSVDDITRDERAGTRLISKGQHPDYDEQAFGLENVGDVSKPFQSSRGWMVIKLVERRPATVVPFEEARDDLRRGLKTIKNEERLNALLEKWQAEVEIKIYDDNLMKADLDVQGKKPVKFS
ncbi:MAG: peptidyl-prolyl cis-trans isomerase [Candidatus Latescibacterota bacterium]|nr:MAG: peptidyl-prolyl cis-trans isomerase [Candidatus Latescibacterota bacterium]